MNKEAYFKGMFGDRRIPVMQSLMVVENDPYLNPFAKTRLSQALTDKKEAGMISKKELLSGALNAGLGFGAAKIVGNGLGSLLALPKPLVQRISSVGGIAGALYNSGVFQDD